MFGRDERLWASGLNSWLEQPGDAAIDMTHSDPVCAKAYKMREAAMKAVVQLDHDEKWKRALKYTSRTTGDQFFPGDQVFYWRRQGSGKTFKGRRAALASRWHGPAVVIGREWEKDRQTSSYWVQHGHELLMVSGLHVRIASLEERMAN